MNIIKAMNIINSRFFYIGWLAGLHIIKELHEAYTDNSGKKMSPVYDSTALTEICEEF